MLADNSDPGATQRNDRGLIGRLVDGGLLLIIVLAPTQYAFDIRGAHLAPVDLAVWGVFALWLLDGLLDFKRFRVTSPPLIMLLFPLLTALSAIKAANRFEAGKEIFQYCEYFGAAAILFSNRMGDRIFFRRLLFVFLAMATLVVGCGLVQYFTPALETFKVRALFGNRNILGGYLALIVPLAYGLLLWDRRVGWRCWMGAVIVAGMVITLSGGTWVALFIALGMISAWRGQKVLIAFLAVFTVVTVLVLPRLPRANLDVIKQSVEIFDDAGEMRPRYTEWQAAWNMWRENPALGVGIGNYQLNIGRYYGYVPRANKNVTERDSHNTYLVLLSSTGLCGLAAFAGILIYFKRCATMWHETGSDPFEKGLSAGVAGAIVAFAVNSVWAGLLVRGLGVPLVFLLALISVQLRLLLSHPLLSKTATS